VDWKGTGCEAAPPPLMGVAGTTCSWGPLEAKPPSPSGALITGGSCGNNERVAGLESGIKSWGGDWGFLGGDKGRSLGSL